MSTKSGTTRWWENYLPRYLMPSIAGMAIVNWLCWYGGSCLRSLLSLPSSGTAIDTASLILLFLYGNLFCYIASYPVLVFHATRVMDSSDGEWPAHPLIDGYIVTSILIAAAFLFHYVPPDCRYRLAFIAALFFSIIQLGRLWNVSAHRFKPKGHGALVSPVYFYTYVLAHRRGIPAVKETTKEDPHKDSAGESRNLPDEDEEEKEEVTTTRSRTNLWRQEFMDTYRHLPRAWKLGFHFSIGNRPCGASLLRNHQARTISGTSTSCNRLALRHLGNTVSLRTPPRPATRASIFPIRSEIKLRDHKVSGGGARGEEI